MFLCFSRMAWSTVDTRAQSSQTLFAFAIFIASKIWLEFRWGIQARGSLVITLYFVDAASMAILLIHELTVAVVVVAFSSILWLYTINLCFLILNGCFNSIFLRWLILCSGFAIVLLLLRRCCYFFLSKHKLFVNNEMKWFYEWSMLFIWWYGNAKVSFCWGF